MSEQEGSKPNLQEKGQLSFRERLAVKAKELPEQVKAAIARAKTASPRNALLNLAGLTPEAKQRRASVKEDRERQEQQQREAQTLVAEIDRIFPEESKDYNYNDRPYTREEYKENRGTLTYRERARYSKSIQLSGTDQVYFEEDKPSYPGLRGNRNITLTRDYIDGEGENEIRARDVVKLTVLQDGKTIQFEDSGRYNRDKIEAYGSYDGAVAYDSIQRNKEFDNPADYSSEVSRHDGKAFRDPVSVLGLGKEIIGAVSKAEAAKAAQPQQAAVK